MALECERLLLRPFLSKSSFLIKISGSPTSAETIKSEVRGFSAETLGLSFKRMSNISFQI